MPESELKSKPEIPEIFLPQLPWSFSRSSGCLLTDLEIRIYASLYKDQFGLDIPVVQAMRYAHICGYITEDKYEWFLWFWCSPK